jgi:hypothetical protein
MLVCGFAAEGAVKCNTVEIKVTSGLCAGKTIKSHKGCFDKEAAATDASSMDNYIKVRVQAVLQELQEGAVTARLCGFMRGLAGLVA